jgi:hypothetical protein
MLPPNHPNRLREEIQVAINTNWVARSRFGPKQQEFIEDMFERWGRYGDRTTLSEKQIQYILSLYDRTTKMKQRNQQ